MASSSSSSATASPITTEEAVDPRSIHRDMYIRLVMNLGRNSAQSLQVLAIWQWLEETGSPNIVGRILPLSDAYVHTLAEEAYHCYRCLVSSTPPTSSSSINIIDDIPLTQYIVGNQRQISLQMLFENKITLLKRICNTVDALAIEYSEIGRDKMAVSDETNIIPPHVVHGIAAAGTGLVNLGGSSSLPERGESSSAPKRNKPSSPNESDADAIKKIKELELEERTMLFTFDREHPVTVRELREYFVSLYGGDSVDSIFMHEAPDRRSAQFARVVFGSHLTVEAILNGNEKAEFLINKKRVWSMDKNQNKGT